MNKTFIFFLALLLCLNKNLIAQNKFFSSHNAYLGQKPPNDTPKIFASVLLTAKDEFSTNRIAITPDGKEIYYGVNKSWKSAKDLKVKYFKYDGVKWVGPKVLNEHLGGTSFSSDYKTLYFASRESAGSVFKSVRTKTGWSQPSEYISRNYVIYDFMPSGSGSKYAASNGTWGEPNDANSWRFSIMPASDADSTIENLGVPLNSPGFNGDFFIAMDESYMIISTKETKSFACELYISFRKNDKTWTNPKTLGPLINDGDAHRYAQYVSPDGKYLFYTRGASEKDCAIYWVRFDKLLEKLHHTNFEPYVKNAIKDQTVSAGHSFSLKIPEDAFIDDDGNNTLTYHVTLADDKPLPEGLTFDPNEKTISGNLQTTGLYKLKVIVTDTATAMAACTFILNIQ